METNKKGEEFKLGYGHYLLAFFGLNFIYGTFSKNITPHSLSPFAALSEAAAGTFLGLGTLYCFIFWIMDLIRKRGGIQRPANKKVRLGISIAFIIFFVLIVSSLLK